MIGQCVHCRSGCLRSPVHLVLPVFYKMIKAQKDDLLVYIHAAYKTAKSLKLPSSGAVSYESPSLVRDLKNHLLPGARAGLVDESQFIYLTLPLLPDVSGTTSLLRSSGGNSIIMNIWDQTLKIINFCSNEQNVRNHVLNMQRLKWKVCFVFL